MQEVAGRVLWLPHAHRLHRAGLRAGGGLLWQHPDGRQQLAPDRGTLDRHRGHDRRPADVHRHTEHDQEGKGGGRDGVFVVWQSACLLCETLSR